MKVHIQSNLSSPTGQLTYKENDAYYTQSEKVLHTLTRSTLVNLWQARPSESASMVAFDNEGYSFKYQYNQYIYLLKAIRVLTHQRSFGSNGTIPCRLHLTSVI